MSFPPLLFSEEEETDFASTSANEREVANVERIAVIEDTDLESIFAAEEETSNLDETSANEEEAIIMATTATATGSVETAPVQSAALMPGVASTSSTLLSGVVNQPTSAGVARVQQDRAERNYGRSWSLAASSAAVSRWVDAESLIAILYEIQRMNFSVAAQRALMFTKLDGIKPVAVGFFGKTRRFPDDKIYVNMNESTVARYLQQLYSGLSYKEFDRVADNNAGRGGASGSEKQQSRVDSQSGRVTNESNDSHMGYMNAVTQLASKVASGELSYDRRKFEREFNLIWELWVGGK